MNNAPNRGKPISWSIDEQFCYIDGHAWAVNTRLVTVWAGTEKDIRAKEAKEVKDG